MFWSVLIRQVTTLSWFVRHIILIAFSKQQGFDSTQGFPTYTHSSLSQQKKILQNHQLVRKSLIYKINMMNLINIIWTGFQSKSPYKQRYIAGSSKCSTKPLSLLPTEIFTVVNEKIQEYCNAIYSRSDESDVDTKKL